MTNELDHITTDILPAGVGFAATTGSDAAIDTLMRHAKAMDIAYEFAVKMCRTSLVPAIYRGKAEDGTAAILYGLELGLNPIQSLQQIFTVHGTPAIYSRTMVALLKTKGYRIWTENTSDESVTVSGRAPDGVTETSTWTIERARTAGYVPEADERTGKFKLNSNGKLMGNEKYLTDPQSMLYAKAAAEVCRKLAPEVLLGMAHSVEDLESDPSPVRATTVTPPRKGVDAVRDALKLDPPPPAEPQPEPAEPEPAEVTDQMPDQPEQIDPDQMTIGEQEDTDEPCTRAQQVKLNILLKNEKLDDRDAKLQYLEHQFGRPFTSSKELTLIEASSLIDYLEQAQAGDTEGGEPR